MGDTAAVTLADNTIHNPNEPRHFMAIKAIPARVKISFRGGVLAESSNAVRVVEVGKVIYDPVIYMPAADVHGALEKTDKTTHCPLKGDASYFAVDGEEVAWSYEAPFAFAAGLTGLRAFWASKVTVEEVPAA